MSTPKEMIASYTAVVSTSTGTGINAERFAGHSLNEFTPFNSTVYAVSAELSTTIAGSSDLNRTNRLVNELRQMMINIGVASS